MAGDEEQVDIRIRLRDARQFVQDAEAAGAKVEKLGNESRKAGEKAGGSGATGFQRLRDKMHAFHKSSDGTFLSLRRLGGILGSLGAAYAGYSFGKSAIEETGTLATNTTRLSQAFGLSTQAAGEYAAAFEVFHTNITSASMGFTTLSRSAQGALAGTPKLVKAYETLGISQQMIAATGGDVDKMFTLVADKLSNVRNGSERAQAGQAILGRGYQQLQPLLRDHGKVLAQVREEAEKYGVVLSGGGLENQRKFMMQEHQMELATLGLKVQFAQGLAPALIEAMRRMTEFVGNAREGKGAAGQFAAVLKEVVSVAKAGAFWMDHHTTAVRRLMLVMIAGYGVFKLYKTAAAGVAAAEVVWAGVQLLLNTELFATDAALAMTGIPVLIAGAALLGFGIAALVEHFGGWKKIIGETWGAIRGFGHTIVAWARTVPHAIAVSFEAAGTSILHAITWPFREAFKYIQNKWRDLPRPLRAALKYSNPLTAAIAVDKKAHGLGLPGFAYGGLAPGGMALVGERGPELAYLERGTRIQPIGDMGARSIVPVDMSGLASAAGTPGVIHTEVKIDRKVVAEAWHTVARNDAARR